MRLNDLRESAQAKHAEAQAIYDLAKEEERELTAEETDAVQELLDERDGYMAQLEQIKRQENLVDRLESTKSTATHEKKQFADPAIQIGGPNIESDPKRGFSSLGEFASLVCRASTPAERVYDERLDMQSAATGMSQGVGSDGGFLVPPSFSANIWDGFNTDPANLLGMTDQYTVEGESLTIPANGETSRADGSRWGGARGYWIAEAAQITSSSPKLRQMKLEPQELAVLVYVTDKLRRNATALDQYLTKVGSSEINFLTGNAIINGTGVGKPLGILNGGCLVSVAKESGQAATTINAKNINKMWSRCHAKSRQRAVWLINQDIEPQLEELSVAVGTGGLPVYLPPGGIADTPNARLKGRPVVPIEYCATLGTVGDIILADLGAYATGVRGAGIESAMSIHLKFDYAETAFRFMWAVDGQPWLASAITPFKGTDNTLSPFVALATRS